MGAITPKKITEIKMEKEQHATWLDFLIKKREEILLELAVCEKWLFVEQEKQKPEITNEEPEYLKTLQDITMYNSARYDLSKEYVDALGNAIKVTDIVVLSELGMSKFKHTNKKGWLVSVNKTGLEFTVNWWGQKTNRVYHRDWIIKSN